MRMPTLLLAALIALPSLTPRSAVAQQAAGQHEMHQRHGDPKAYAASLDDPKRDAYQKPDEVVKALALTPGQTVADIGAGTGYFSLRLARAVGDTGRVYAVDVSPDMMQILNRRVRDHDLPNVVGVLAPGDDPLLREGSVDVVFFCNVWHHIDDQSGYLEHLRRALKPGGRLVMIDFHKRDLPVGPPMGMKIAREDLIAQLEQAGWRQAREHEFLPYQYFVEFTPAP
jgi:arsenite methyltransferase